MIQLSARLQEIAKRVPSGARVADIGSDHAWLPVWLVHSGQVHAAIAGEYHEGPYRAAQRKVAAYRLGDRIAVRRGNGLAVLEPGEVDTIVIAGMGGSLIATILEEGKDKLVGVSRLVLQPNVGEDFVRRWLEQYGWNLVEEHILQDGDKVYEILVAEVVTEGEQAVREKRYGKETMALLPAGVDADWLFRLGPHLVKQRPELLVSKWQRELEKWEKMYVQMGEASSEQALARRQELAREMEQLKEVLTCWQMDTPSSR